MRVFKGSERAGISILTAGVVFLLGLPVSAQQPAARITAEIDARERVPLAGSHSPQARPENDSGRVSPETRLEGIGIVFRRTDAQEKDLQALIAEQQDSASPLYHRWLTPEEFAARFGLADADLAAVRSWLEQQGFTVDEVARSKNQMRFSGTARQAEAAFGTELHYYTVDGERHFAPSADVTLPTSLAPVVQAVTNLSTFRPRSHIVRKSPQPATQYHFTSGQTQNHFLTPKDIATIYDINPAYSAGLTGARQKIAVVGQSEIVMTDIEHFQTAAGFGVQDPTRTLVPSSGTATIVAGDESESDLDLEYASTIAPGATVYFVYTGNNANFNVWNALQYAITQNLAPIITSSYGICEPLLPLTQYTALNAFLAQAASQGQTVVAAAGDGGSTDCSGTNGATTAQQQELSVDFPASSQYVTGIGGSEFPAGDVTSTNTTYWSTNGTTDVISSAKSYIPETAWNDDSASGISSGGGGVSLYTTPRPSWQTGVAGIPSGTFRVVPDISLSASADNAGYLYCSSDTTTNITGSCTPGNGFRDSNDSLLTVAGGTSFGAPIFAGMIALINQKTGTPQGVVNSKLYSLAANASTYASAFHDITSGNNNCTSAGAATCPSTLPAATDYSATTGYDLATGLGSIDFNGLLAAWSGTATTKSFALTASAATVPAGGTGTSTVTITPQNGYTGTIAWTISSSPSSADLCFSMANVTVSGASAVTASLSVKTSASACGTAAISGTTGKQRRAGLSRRVVESTAGPLSTVAVGQITLVAAALLWIGLGVGGRWASRLRLVSCSLLLVAAGLATSGCSGVSNSSSSSSSSGNAATGTYSVTITGTDTVTSSITASTTMTLTID